MPMKLRSLLFLIALSLPAFADSAKHDDEKAVLAAEKQYADAMVKGDAAPLEKLLADDLAYTHSNALTQTKADVLKGITSGTTKYKAIEYKTSKVRQYRNTVVTNHEMMITTPTSTNKLYVTMVWVKQPAGWQLVERQATKLPD